MPLNRWELHRLIELELNPRLEKYQLTVISQTRGFPLDHLVGSVGLRCRKEVELHSACQPIELGVTAARAPGQRAASRARHPLATSLRSGARSGGVALVPAGEGETPSF
jgi:hypothetical protein